MSPIRPCPFCKRETDFHEDELEGVEDGRVVCLQCGLETAEAAFITDVIAGKHDDLVQQILEEQEDED